MVDDDEYSTLFWMYVSKVLIAEKSIQMSTQVGGGYVKSRRESATRAWVSLVVKCKQPDFTVKGDQGVSFGGIGNVSVCQLRRSSPLLSASTLGHPCPP